MKGYEISHNITGSVLVNQTTYTAFVFENVTPGAYLFTVLAVNILGDGVEESIVLIVSGTCTMVTKTYQYLLCIVILHTYLCFLDAGPLATESTCIPYRGGSRILRRGVHRCMQNTPILIIINIKII